MHLTFGTESRVKTPENTVKLLGGKQSLKTWQGFIESPEILPRQKQQVRDRGNGTCGGFHIFQ